MLLRSLATFTICTSILQQSESFTPSKLFNRPSNALPNLGLNESASVEPASSLTSPPRTIAVTGATGRTGRLVVSKLLETTNHNVIAVVRDETKANEIFDELSINGDSDRLTIQTCDLLNEKEISNLISSTSTNQVIWCSTGFSSNPDASPIAKFRLIWNAVVNKGENTIDYVGLTTLANEIDKQKRNDSNSGPNVIMLSSAAVTRPSWSEEKKERFAGCADIPIVRLNPFDILNIKATSEERLRKCSGSDASYTIVRPTGLKDGDDWPSGSSNARPIISQGDIAAGRIHRSDVASLLVSCLDETNVMGKTFEVFTIGGYPSPTKEGLSSLFKSLRTDDDIETNGFGVEDCRLQATYFAMQQLLPGETQDAAALAMGQTYEELDEGKVGRLGVRGEEQAESVAPQPSPV